MIYGVIDINNWKKYVVKFTQDSFCSEYEIIKTIHSSTAISFNKVFSAGKVIIRDPKMVRREKDTSEWTFTVMERYGHSADKFKDAFLGRPERVL